MIFVDIKGNIGNQMFIYAFARKVQEKTGQKIYFSTYNIERFFPNYKCSLQEFKLNNNVEIGNKKLPFFINDNFILIKLFNKLFKGKLKSRIEKIYYNILFKFGYVYWTNIEYRNIDYEKLKSKKNIYINGFFQSSQYFDDIKDILLEELSSKKGIEKKNRDLYNTIISSNSVCVSIRRGDFVEDTRIIKRYYLCDIDYYERAIKKINSYNDEDLTIICFSDDIQWVKENIHFDYPTYYEDGDDTVSQKILLMSSCKNFVLSNSSFSWWTNYLAAQAKITIAPSRWYSNEVCENIYSKEWETIPVGEDLKNE